MVKYQCFQTNAGIVPKSISSSCWVFKKPSHDQWSRVANLWFSLNFVFWR